MSSTNRGSARSPLDAYYTPDELARALVDTLDLPTGSTVWEPHAGGGAFVRALEGAGARCVFASDFGRPAFLDARLCGDRWAESRAEWDALSGWPFVAPTPDWILAERPSFTAGGTDSAAYGFFLFDREHSGAAEVVPGWSWKGGNDV